MAAATRRRWHYRAGSDTRFRTRAHGSIRLSWIGVTPSTKYPRGGVCVATIAERVRRSHFWDVGSIQPRDPPAMVLHAACKGLGWPHRADLLAARGEGGGRGLRQKGPEVSDWTMQHRTIVAARLLAVAAAAVGAALLLGIGLTQPPPHQPDWMAYRGAADRLLAGQPLYPPTSPDDPLAYRYAPWFAFAFIPFALLGSTGTMLWFTLLTVAALYTVVATFRLGGHAGLVLGLIALPSLGAVPGGNAGVLMMAVLIATRMHPLAVGAAGSLKIYPLLLVIGYVAERRWRDVILAIGIAVLLWAPALAFDLSGYVSSPGGGGISVYAIHPFLWVAQDAILLVVVGWLAARGSPWTWLALAAAVPLIPPRTFLVGAGYFTAAALRMVADRRPQERSRPPEVRGEARPTSTNPIS